MASSLNHPFRMKMPFPFFIRYACDPMGIMEFFSGTPGPQRVNIAGPLKCMGILKGSVA